MDREALDEKLLEPQFSIGPTDRKAVQELLKPVTSELESITRERYLVLANLANNFIVENEQRLSQGELDTFLELLQTLWRMKK